MTPATGQIKIFLATMPSGVGFLFLSLTPCPYLAADPASIASAEPIPRYTLNIFQSNSITSEGDSVQPANNPPTITALANVNAFTISPEPVIPPSAIIDTHVCCAIREAT